MRADMTGAILQELLAYDFRDQPHGGEVALV